MPIIDFSAVATAKKKQFEDIIHKDAQMYFLNVSSFNAVFILSHHG